MTSDPLPLVLESAPFRVAEALRLGVPASRLRRGDLARPFHGVRARRPATDLVARCSDLLPVVRPGVAFSHTTAAALWQLPLPLGAADGDLHLVGPVAERRRRAGVIAHAQSRPATGEFIEGVPVVDAVTTWLQCAQLLPLDDVIAMGDALAGRWSPHERAREIDLDRLARAVERWGGRRGSRRLRAAMLLVRADVWSPRETALRLLLVRAGLPEPEPNGAVTDASGAVLGHGDLVYRRQRVVVEYEGDGHRTSRSRWRRDIARHEAFHDAGWQVLRVTDDDLADPGILVARLCRLLGIGRPA